MNNPKAFTLLLLLLVGCYQSHSLLDAPDAALPDVVLLDVTLPDVVLPDVVLLDVALPDASPDVWQWGCDAPPPEPVCVADALRTFEPGVLGPRGCEYPTIDTSCTFGCENGRCIDICDEVGLCGPPPSECFGPGSCDPSSGLCQYGFADGVNCDDGDSGTSGDSCLAGVCSGRRSTVVEGGGTSHVRGPRWRRSMLGGE